MGDEGAEIRRGLAMARDQRADLVPFVGAGMSLALGLPGWLALVAALTAGEEVDPDRDPADVLQSAAQRMGATQFARAVQHELRSTDLGTTRALQALARSGARRVLTTNLDYAIERAYELAGAPLRPEDVGRGASREELALFESSTGSPVLLKLHGSLERPSTWVLTRDQYDDAYVDRGRLRDFLSARVPRPLFLGFSLADRDVYESYRLGQVRWWTEAFAVLRLPRPDDPAGGLRDRLRSMGIVPLWVHDHSQIPEVIDEIFGCGRGTPALVREIVEDEVRRRPTVDVDELGAIVDNAIEVQPMQSVVDGRQRRRTGPRFEYRDRLARLARRARTAGDTDAAEPARETLVAALRALSSHRDVLLDELLPWSLKNELDHYLFLSACAEALASDRTAARLLEDRLVARLFDPTLAFDTRRALARLVARWERHPAQEVPPPTVRIGRWHVPIFPLTRHQVHRLRPDPADEAPSLRPYTLAGPGRPGAEREVTDLLARLDRATGRSWRLPTVQEWQEIARRGESAGAGWPWGDGPPCYQRHAHLTFADHRGRIARHPVDVGLFPEGRHSAGLFDLIGNVYEIVSTADGYALAGGAWTTVVRTPARFRPVKPWGRGSNNVGLRPITEDAPS